MKQSKKIILLIIAAVFLSSIFLQPLLAGTSISGIVTCRMPHIIAMSEKQEALAEDQSDKIVDNEVEAETLSMEQASKEIKQQEKVISEETKEVELINTVCAR